MYKLYLTPKLEVMHKDENTNADVDKVYELSNKDFESVILQIMDIKHTFKASQINSKF